MSHLVPCPECERHVRVHETTCPFCGGALSLAATPPPVLPRTRLGRAALFAFGATLIGATALGCSDDDEGGGKGGSGGSAGASTGGSSGDAGAAGASTGGSAGASGASGAAGAAGGPAPMYGAPPDDGGGAALYGAAP